MYDQDGDGKLGYDDVAWLMKATHDDAWSTKHHDEACAVVGATDKLITKEQLFASYQSRLDAIEEDWSKLKAKAKAKVKTSTSRTPTSGSATMLESRTKKTICPSRGKRKIWVASLETERRLSLACNERQARRLNTN